MIFKFYLFYIVRDYDVFIVQTTTNPNPNGKNIYI